MFQREIRPVIERNKQRYAVLTKPQKEAYTELNLCRRGIEHSYPKLANQSHQDIKSKLFPYFQTIYLLASRPFRPHGLGSWIGLLG